MKALARSQTVRIVLVSTRHWCCLNGIMSNIISDIKRHHSSVMRLLLLEAPLCLMPGRWNRLDCRSIRVECLLVYSYWIGRSDLTGGWIVEFAIYSHFVMLRRLCYVVDLLRVQWNSCLVNRSPVTLLSILTLPNVPISIPCFPEVLQLSAISS
jgi:hypothetical protein